MRLYLTTLILLMYCYSSTAQGLLFRDYLKIYTNSNIDIMYIYDKDTSKLEPHHFVFSDELLTEIYDSDDKNLEKVKKYQERATRKSDYKYDSGIIHLDFWPYWETVKDDLIKTVQKSKKETEEGTEKEQEQQVIANQKRVKRAIPITTVEFDTSGEDLEIKDVNFFIKLTERQTLKIKRRSVAIGAFTIPARIHLNGRGESNSLFTADLNVGLYIAKEFGKTRFQFNKFEAKEVNNVWGVGLFGMLNGQELKSTNTSDQLTITTTEPFFSPGIVLYKRIEKINFFSSVGIDMPITSNGNKWDFANEPWIGFGFGIEIF
ncbi:hypothetical protein [Marivirga harenae]|uniref:hypothetical protein n=1 Tax=Marivirga harenae TaxID=2010992 RepID=UPI0026E10FA9|nr:hypothetical protein [Marivirga harenae]WKV11270.1 hypothetical protein Q3Y49_13745 [Marivirga harenae]